jgi:3,4-dihydroxy-2-butanone 4-phosphate synthase
MTSRCPETVPPDASRVVEEAIAAVARGEMVVVTDDDDRENEGDLIMAADHVTPEAVTFMIIHGRGLICLAMTEADAGALALPPMVENSEDHMATAFTVSIDGTPATGVTTGISASDRAETIRRAVARKTHDIQRPGHVFPLVAMPGGVCQRRGHTEAAVDLARCAEREPMGVIVEIIGDDGEMLRGAALTQFAAEHGLVKTSIDALSRYLEGGAAHVDR